MNLSTRPLKRLGVALLVSLGFAAASVRSLSAPPMAPGHPIDSGAAAPLNFERDVRPILAENCFTCHGFDAGKRMADLRLDTVEGATHKLQSGHTPVVPRHPEESEVMKRVTDKASPMPPAYSGKKPLTEAQVETLKRWIEQGAAYGIHWAFVPPKRPALPPVKNAKWVRNPIDRFVLARLEKEGLKPSPEADKTTLIRRLSLDLTGIPPTPQEVDRFLADDAPDAYDRLVNRLLDSPRYGERMALKWLDLARYADTHGYHIDSQRDMWRWREWVINAFNSNMPYDEFTVEQLAGDLLPHPTLSQRVATGFNRNHPIDFEGGAIPEEYQAAYIFDRIDATSTTFMGLTARCAQCHDHKYDPITQKEYYKLYAFFNNIAEQGLDGQNGNAAPTIKVPYPDQEMQLASYQKNMDDLQAKLKARPAEVGKEQAEWEKKTLAELEKAAPITEGLEAHYPLDDGSGDSAKDALGKQVASVKGKTDWAKGKIGKAFRFDGDTHLDLGNTLNFERTDKYSYGAWINPSELSANTVISHMDDGNNFRGWDLYLGDGKAFVHIIHEWEKNALRITSKAMIPANQWTHIFVTYDGSSKAAGIKLYINGQPADVDITHDTLTDTIKTDKPARIGRRTSSAPFKGLIDDVRVYHHVLSPDEVSRLASLETLLPLLKTPPEKRTAEQKETLSKYYLENVDPTYKQINSDLATWRSKYDDLDKAIPTSMVMQERDQKRDTHLLIRGQYDQLGEVVTPGTPAFLPPLPPGMPANRLALAKWLVSPSHPLTARVEVNRLWEMLFGLGIVKTSEDFGTRCEPPSHPELLDWLATEFIRTGWDMKAMMRLIVTSATYRQSSKATSKLLERDPENRLLARAPRFRLQAELIRDQALAVSGLLVEKIGGPSVKPYQPAGLWEEISFKGGFSAQYFEQDHGDALYRRGMYTFWKRTVPPPNLQTFDAPEREFCIVRRSNTNTPLQALVLMNDPTYVEASRHLAERMMTEGGFTDEDHARYGFRLALCRKPTDEEMKTLLALYNQEGVKFRKDPEAAKKLLSVGESPRNEKLDTAQLAAWTSVANVLLNLDETISKS
jgi:hypothetical protein